MTAPPVAPSFCYQCGCRLAEGGRFCGACGTSVSRTDVAGSTTQYGQTRESPGRVDLAIWSVVAGLAGLIFYFAALAGVPAIVLGSKAWNRLDRRNPYRWAAGIGITLGIMATLAWLGSIMRTAEA